STIDPYSFTQDVPWINHEWLSEALMGAAYTAAGPFGLVFLKAAQLICVFALIVTALRHADYGRRWGALALAGAAVLPLAYTLRPQLWTLLFLVALCRLLNEPRSNLRYVPLLFLAWANLHGGWVVGLGVLGVWSAASTLSPTTRRQPPL